MRHIVFINHGLSWLDGLRQGLRRLRLLIAISGHVGVERIFILRLFRTIVQRVDARLIDGTAFRLSWRIQAWSYGF